MAYVRPAIFNDPSWSLVGGVVVGAPWVPPYGDWVGVGVYDDREPPASPRFWVAGYQRGDGYESLSQNGPSTGPGYSAAWMLARTNDHLAWAYGVGANAFYDPTAAIIQEFLTPQTLTLPPGVQEVFHYVGGGGEITLPGQPVPCDPIVRPPFPYGDGLYLNPTPPADVRYHRLPVN